VSPGAARPALLLALLASVACGCGARYVRVPVHEGGDTVVKLRSQTKGGEPVDRGFSHPATISGVRVAHILAAVDVRLGEGDKSERRGAVPTSMLYEVGDLVSKAFAKADSSQEVVVQALRRQRRLGLFQDEHLTSFTTWIEGDQMHIAFSRIDSPLAPQRPDDERLPEPWPGKEAMAFRVLPTSGVVPTGPQSVAVDWRSDAFRKGTNLSVGARGEVRRKTILMESPAEAEPAAGGAEPVPGDLSPDALRALADLEEERRAGAISEAEYHVRRRAILVGGSGAPGAAAPATPSAP
jgi:hypothetical protein